MAAPPADDDSGEPVHRPINESHEGSMQINTQHLAPEPQISLAEFHRASPSEALGLIETYPRQAVRLLGSDTPEHTARVVSLMDDDQLLLVGAGLDPDRVRAIVRHVLDEEVAGLLAEAADAHTAITTAAARWHLGRPVRSIRPDRTIRLRRTSPSARGGAGYVLEYPSCRVLWSERTGPGMISNDTLEYLTERGGLAEFGFPIGPEVEIVSCTGEVGVAQRFESTEDYPTQIVLRHGVRDLGQHWGATVYRCERFGPHATFGAIGRCYEEAGAASGPFGLPTSDPGPMPQSRRCVTQWFERARIFWRKGDAEAIAVAGAVFDLGRRDPAWFDRLGMPLAEEVPAPGPTAHGPDSIQFFEGGVVTVRASTPAAALYPSALDPPTLAPSALSR